MKTALLLAALISTSASAFDIKGFKVDEPLDCAAVKALSPKSLAMIQACERGVNPRIYVDGPFLSQSANFMFKRGPDSVLLDIYVTNFDFDEALAALTLKWGKPVLEHSTVTNRMGATFDQVEATWKKDTYTLVLKKHAGKIDHPSLFLVSSRSMDRFNQEQAEKLKKNADNI